MRDSDFHRLIVERRAALDEPARRRARRLLLWASLGALALAGGLALLLTF